ncbi:MAG TPA: hypothetical protein DCS89_05135 [Gammaproteobacteria bacterium]|nr:hypothetical protein [Gammaproteobacteria bacterium]
MYADSISLTRLWKALVETGLATNYLRFTCMKPNMGTQNGSRFSLSQKGFHTGNARLQGAQSGN